MRLVYTGTDGALYAWRRAQPTTRLTWPWEEMVGGAPVGLSYAWPTCSRNGSRVLALARRGADRHFLYVVDVDGVVAEEVAALGETAPIYANWSPDGTRVAVLLQRGGTLALDVVALAGERAPRTVARGAPLFWSWSPDGRTLAVHSGQSVDDMSVGGTVLVDAESGQVVDVLGRVLAPYRAPSWSADGRWLAFARLAEHGTRLVLRNVESGERCTRELEAGAVAFVWHPRRPILAYVVARDDAPHVYERIVCLDLQDERERVIGRPAIACAWHPDVPRLFRLAVAQARDALVWEYEEEGDDAPATTVVRFVPTREIVFAASFFDQYAGSHAAVAPDGSMLAVAGRVPDEAGSKVPHVYAVGTESREVTLVGEGITAVWTA
ncbi:MAG TPA: hypothetical protein VGK30_14975 [Candidatus Binatia bacterium]|jgi:TolB protein